eukprot:SAG11_NODE_791_length_7146_cov_49.170427_8_plen_141_part_00
MRQRPALAELPEQREAAADLAKKLVQLGGELARGRPSPDHHERQQPLPLRLAKPCRAADAAAGVVVVGVSGGEGVDGVERVRPRATKPAAPDGHDRHQTPQPLLFLRLRRLRRLRRRRTAESVGLEALRCPGPSPVSSMG